VRRDAMTEGRRCGSGKSDTIQFRPRRIQLRDRTYGLVQTVFFIWKTESSVA
jgi:hypothetical protein